ncbi:MAG TPA: hypothetical protein VJZ27_19475 [Aggregatilineales bacterium]|nr:hypothetical protein [Aggregatilineales bacterium]
MATHRFRLGFKFWLNIENPQEQEIAEHIEDLKQSRTFAKTIRDGIRLIYDLRRGKTEVLQELFPWVLEQNISPSEMPDDSPKPDANAKLEAHIERLEQLLLQQGAMPVENSKPSQAPVPVKRESSAPDDFEITVTPAKNDENNRSDWNFAIASAATIYGNYDALPRKIIEYGVRTGKIPAEMIQHRWKQSPAQSGIRDNPKQMEVPQFSVPDFGDFDDASIDLFG